MKLPRQIRPALLMALLIGLLPLNLSAQPSDAKPVEALLALQTALSNRVAQPHLGAAALGIKVVSLNSGKIIFSYHANKLLKPASNAKLYTGALALDRLGPAHRITTSIYATAKPTAEGTLEGDLIVYGRGDPSFAARFHDGDYAQPLELLLHALSAAGVKHINGDLIGDESFFHGPPLGTSWAWDDLQEYYGAEVSALTLQDNVVDLLLKPAAEVGKPVLISTKPVTDYLTFINRTTTATNGGRRSVSLYRPPGENTVYLHGTLPLGGPDQTESIAIHQPARWFVTRLKEALSKRGIAVDGKLRTVNWLDREAAPVDYAKLVELASVQSRPLSEILAKMMKPSQNLYAQLLLLQVGVNRNPKPEAQNTETAGVAELNKFLAEIGLKRGEVLLQEGAGLSRTALLTPNATVTLLRHMANHRHADVFRDALPLAGVDGTLRSRFKGTPAEKNVRAKTGSLSFVSTLSGYITTAANEPLVFSIMLNNYEATDATHSGRAEVDALVALLASFSGRSEEQ